MDVAVLGTGTIGFAMARNLQAAGHQVRAWNRSREKAEPLAQDGAEVCADPAEACAGAEVVLTVLTDGDTTGRVVAKAGLAEGQTWWQVATVGLAGHERLAAMAADAGARYVDGPVLGTKKPAEDGALLILASGPDAALDRCAPLFEATGARALRLGEAGRGTRLKLVLNSWLLGLTTALADSIRLAEALELDPRSFLQTIEGGPIDVPYAKLKGGLMIDGAFPTSFSVDNAAKDAGLVVEAAERSGLALALAPVVRDQLRRTSAEGFGDEDLAAVVRALG